MLNTTCSPGRHDTLPLRVVRSFVGNVDLRPGDAAARHAAKHLLRFLLHGRRFPGTERGARWLLVGKMPHLGYVKPGDVLG